MSRKKISFYYFRPSSFSFLGSFLGEQASSSGLLLCGPFCLSSPSCWVISIYLVSVDMLELAVFALFAVSFLVEPTWSIVLVCALLGIALVLEMRTA